MGPAGPVGPVGPVGAVEAARAADAKVMAQILAPQILAPVAMNIRGKGRLFSRVPRRNRWLVTGHLSVRFHEQQLAGHWLRAGNLVWQVG